MSEWPPYPRLPRLDPKRTPTAVAALAGIVVENAYEKNAMHIGGVNGENFYTILTVGR